MTRSLIFAAFLLAGLAWPGDGPAQVARTAGHSATRQAEQTRRADQPVRRTPDSSGEVPPGSPDRPIAQIHSGTAEAPVPDYRLGDPPGERSLLWEGVRMLLSLAAVLVLLGWGVKLLRRWPGLGSRESLAGQLQILGRLALTPKEAICLVRAGAEVLVVGVSPAGVTLLTRLAEGAAEAAGLASPTTGLRAGSESRSTIASRLRDLRTCIREVQAVWGIGSTDLRGER
ncbi:MAG TPA: flagellar biosynthetic protein FliO [Candidatus Methylomirabilis sp.]|nr:flagellar biosynthetic protein FliO [Candidatus Methylomirabilis sp.]